jgi:hypothetical protein
VTSASAGRYRVEARNEAGVSAAEIVLEVIAPAGAQGAPGALGGAASGGAVGTVTVGTVSARWWVYDVESAADSGAVAVPSGLPAYWIHDRVLQRSAWLTCDKTRGTVRADVWAEDDLQGVRAVSAAGVELELSGLRATAADGARWEGLRLAGPLGALGMPERLGGVYEAGVPSVEHPVRLQWNATRTQALVWYADWEGLITALEGGEERLDASPPAGD